MPWLLKIPLLLMLGMLSLVSSACGPVRVVATMATDCIWYRPPPLISEANKEQYRTSPDPANAGAFFDVVRDNKLKYKEFCASSPRPPK